MAPITRKWLAREAIERNIEGVVDSPHSIVAVLKDIACYIDKFISLSWPEIFREFIINQKVQVL